jgi:hypothetical protein
VISNVDFYCRRSEVGDFDLAINTASFNEMGGSQVQFYGEAISDLLNEGGILFEINSDVADVNAADLKPVFLNFFSECRDVPVDDDLLKGASAHIWTGRRKR